MNSQLFTFMPTKQAATKNLIGSPVNTCASVISYFYFISEKLYKISPPYQHNMEYIYTIVSIECDLEKVE